MVYVCMLGAEFARGGVYIVGLFNWKFARGGVYRVPICTCANIEESLFAKLLYIPSLNPMKMGDFIWWLITYFRVWISPYSISHILPCDGTGKFYPN